MITSQNTAEFAWFFASYAWQGDLIKSIMSDRADPASTPTSKRKMWSDMDQTAPNIDIDPHASCNNIGTQSNTLRHSHLWSKLLWVQVLNLSVALRQALQADSADSPTTPTITPICKSTGLIGAPVSACTMVSTMENFDTMNCPNLFCFSLLQRSMRVCFMST